MTKFKRDLDLEADANQRLVHCGRKLQAFNLDSFNGAGGAHLRSSDAWILS